MFTKPGIGKIKVRGTLGGLCVLPVLLFFVMPFVTEFECYNYLGSNIGIFAQKMRVFDGPLHFKDHAPSPLCLSTMILTNDDCTHSEKMTVSVMSYWDVVLIWILRASRTRGRVVRVILITLEPHNNMEYGLKTTRHERSQSNRQNRSQCMTLTSAPQPYFSVRCLS